MHQGRQLLSHINQFGTFGTQQKKLIPYATIVLERNGEYKGIIPIKSSQSEQNPGRTDCHESTGIQQRSDIRQFREPFRHGDDKHLGTTAGLGSSHGTSFRRRSSRRLCDSGVR